MTKAQTRSLSNLHGCRVTDVFPFTVHWRHVHSGCSLINHCFVGIGVYYMQCWIAGLSVNLLICLIWTAILQGWSYCYSHISIIIYAYSTARFLDWGARTHRVTRLTDIYCKESAEVGDWLHSLGHCRPRSQISSTRASVTCPLWRLRD